jgi:hypothetical protein
LILAIITVIPGEVGYQNNSNRPLTGHLINGHILRFRFLNAASNFGFSEGTISFTRKSNIQQITEDLRHFPSIFSRKSSLKTIQTRVLGTTVLLESTLKILAKRGKLLK